MPDPWLERAVHWVPSGDVLAPWLASHEGHSLSLRLGDFPAEPLYTLVVDDADVVRIESWPSAWTREDDGEPG